MGMRRKTLLVVGASLCFPIALWATDQGPQDSTSPGTSPSMIEPGHPMDASAVAGPLPSDNQIPVETHKSAVEDGPQPSLSKQGLRNSINSLQKQLADPNTSPEDRVVIRKKLEDLQVKQMSQPTATTRQGSPDPTPAH